MDFGVILQHSIPLGGLSLVSWTTIVFGISEEWNVVGRPCFAIAELGTFSRIILNGFWNRPVIFHSPRWPQPSVVDGSRNWNLGEWNVAGRPCFAIAKLGTFSHIILHGFWSRPATFHSPRWPQPSVVDDNSIWYLGGMKCCRTTLFCHSRTGHFFSYNPQWILESSCNIPFP
jgi:hypothetical protein